MAAYTTIDNPELFFQVVLYTGNGSANHAITLPGDEDMQPDIVWIKNRDATDSQCLFDAVRGATKLLPPDSNVAETTDTDTLDSFTSDGFQVDADVKVNTNAEKYVAWCWKANGTGSSNTSGSINTGSTSVNTTSGVAISTYEGNGTSGATIGHGLGAVPKLFIVKGRTTGKTQGWQTYNVGIDATAPEDYFISLNTNGASYNQASYWNDTAPTASVFSVGNDVDVNTDGDDYVAYLWTDIQGFSKFGSYTGNDNADGTFVYLGFRPAFVIIKNAEGDSGDRWVAFDSKREGYNVDNDSLAPDDTGVEATTDEIDLLSNGFKLRVATANLNDADNYIYWAWAEAPLVNSNGVPNNAR